MVSGDRPGSSDDTVFLDCEDPILNDGSPVCEGIDFLDIEQGLTARRVEDSRVFSARHRTVTAWPRVQVFAGLKYGIARGNGYLLDSYCFS